MTHLSKVEVEAMAARADDAGRLAAFALGFGDAMEKALAQIEDQGLDHSSFADILRAALEGWKP